MASSKRLAYKVETNLATERKRRKSDLVVMWQSIWGVSVIIVKELWITLVRMWEFIQIWFSSSERFLVQTWLEKYLPYVPEDFSESWRDGRLLAILLNKLQPGCFPDAAHLDPDYGLRNVYKTFDALETHFGIRPNVSVEEIVTCSNGSDSKLFEILLQLKNLTENEPENEEEPEPEPAENTEPSGVSQSCIAKGTGLAVGFVGRTTNFIIFCAVISDLDVIVEIKGPNSICSERITKRSPRKRRSVSSLEYAKHLTRSVSLNENNNSLVTEEDDNFEKRIIPLEYEIIGNQINLDYKPREKGKHKVTILWHGQHVSDSPYFVTVEDPSEIIGSNHTMHLKSALKHTNESEKHNPRKISVRFQESQINSKKQETSCSKVVSRKVLRYIVKIHGKDIPVNAENTESLATELLKMDYDFETCPSFHRRNSWGFAGEVERKKSVIRQFCIDVNELEAQLSQRRSRSLSVNPRSKKLLEKSDSFDSLTSKLNILNEDVFESCEKAHENERDYAYIHENIDSEDEKTEITSTQSLASSKENISNEKENKEIKSAQHQTNSEEEIKTVSLSSKLTESKFVVESLKDSSSCEIKIDKISSLSTDTTKVERVDNSEDDLQSNVSSYFPIPKSNQPVVYKDKMSPNYQHSNMELPDDGIRNKKINSVSSKYVQTSSGNKIRKASKRKKYKKNTFDPSHSFKKFRMKRKFKKYSLHTFYRKIYRYENSLSLSPVKPLRKKLGKSRHMLETKKNISELLKIFDTTEFGKPINSDIKYENEKLGDSTEDVSSENINIYQEFNSELTNTEGDKYSAEEPCIKSKEEEKTEVFNTFSNTDHQEEPKDISRSSKRLQEPEIKKLVSSNNLEAQSKFLLHSNMEIEDKSILNPKSLRTHTLEPVGQFLLNRILDESFSSSKQSELKTKDITSGKSEPLRIHSLKTLEQFNFKQFNPPFDAPSSISPIKIQIGHWESTLSAEKETSSQKSCTADIEQVSVKEKLAFWENAYKGEQSSSSKATSENKRKINLVVNKKFPEGNSDSVRNDLQNYVCTGIISNIPVSTTKELTGAYFNQETSATDKKQIEDKISTKLQLNPHKIRRRSFSDPVVSETTTEKADDSANFSSLDSSRKEYSSSSTDDNLKQYESDDSEDSGGDYLLHSTEDEYIDDEISERASEYWGDLSIVKGWKEDRCAIDYSFLGEEFFQNYYYRDKSYPKECKVFGIAVYYGYVAVKNRFQVYTGDAGFGNLSVSMQGFRQHEVSLVSVAYARNDIYEVTYQVMTAGYYLISIRWMDKEIPGSPFVCKVTF